MALAPASLQTPVHYRAQPRVRGGTAQACEVALEDHVQGGSGCKGQGLVRNDIDIGVKLAMVVLAAGVLALGLVDGAKTIRSGGRVGGLAFAVVEFVMLSAALPASTRAVPGRQAQAAVQGDELGDRTSSLPEQTGEPPRDAPRVWLRRPPAHRDRRRRRYLAAADAAEQALLPARTLILSCLSSNSNLVSLP